MNWTQRLAKVLASWINGYSAGLGTIFTLSAYESWQIDFSTLFLIPGISGLIVSLPQLAKVVNEIGNKRVSE